ncbi:ferritin-like protein [Maricaulis sp.]|uniref:ferritin-like domain-containing protein n=1 Tax=Maricaulis sp. TaxID=1486257 RepID=UPI002635E9AE|nr:ferritin-like protein [Maricaulis sp.]
MIKLVWTRPESIEDVRSQVQTAVNLEFSTLPPYLYALLSIPPGENEEARKRIHDISMQEMIHMCLACNILNAIGGSPQIAAPRFPGRLPGDVAGGMIVHLFPFSPAAAEQGMRIEQPEDPIDPPALLKGMAEDDTAIVTIGEYYERLKHTLAQLPASDWHQDRHQIDDSQYMLGNLFKVNRYADAAQAIDNIVSEGEGTPQSGGSRGSPLDFQNEMAHYYRFWEIRKNKVLTRANNPIGYQWGPQTLGIDWRAVYPAITDPETHDFSNEPPAAQAAQAECNTAYGAMIDALQLAFNGQPGQLGVAVRAMFDLRMAARKALTTPLNDGRVAGPAFVVPGGNWVASNEAVETGELA